MLDVLEPGYGHYSFAEGYFQFAFQVDWGEASMIQAERILLKSALEDFDNKRFVFVSDRWASISFYFTF